MLYKFKSKATGDVLMLGPDGDRLLSILGREPAPKGIIEPAAMAQAVALLKAAADADDAQRAQAGEADGDAGSDAGGSEHATGRRGLPLRRRLWPMVDMLTRAEAAGQPVVWGV